MHAIGPYTPFHPAPATHNSRTTRSPASNTNSPAIALANEIAATYIT